MVQEYPRYGQGEYNNQQPRKPMKKKKSKKTRIYNAVIYCVSATLIIIAAVILIKENFLLSKEDKTHGLVSEQEMLENPNVVLEPVKQHGAPISDYDIIPVQFHFIEKESSCDIYCVGFDETKSMESVKSAKDVAWLSTDPYVVPGDVGNAVIAGHNLWKGEAGTFSQLKSLRIGEVVAVTFDKGFSRYFEVESINEYPYDDNTPMKPNVDEPILTLITCKGNWDDDLQQSKTRIVVVCKPLNDYKGE